MGRHQKQMYIVAGYAPRDSKLYEDLTDFRIGTGFGYLEMDAGLAMGHLPPGLIVLDGSGVKVVAGRYCMRQRLVTLGQWVRNTQRYYMEESGGEE